MSFKQSVSFKLDKPYLQECFEQTASPVTPKDYGKAIVFALAGFALLFVEAEQYYIPFFLIALSILELFSIKYRQTWWVWRQLLGKSGNSQVELTFDEQGVTTSSEYVNSQILWSDVTEIKQTEKGILLKHKGGNNYLSINHLNKEIIDFIKGKI